MLLFRRSVSFRGFFGIFFLLSFLFVAQNVLAVSTITGMVFDKQRNAVSDLDVELLNDYYQQIRRTKTDGSGRYSFGGLVNGRYSVKVYAFRHDLEDQTLPVEINAQNARGGEGTEYVNLDFYLSPRKGGLADAESRVVFAQDVPEPAKKLYNKAIEDLNNKRINEGILGLNAAVQSFPQYYSALYRLGKELFIKGKNLEAAQSFAQAVQVNPKSATSLYYLGFSLSNLGKENNKSAIIALKAAMFLAPTSPQILVKLAKIERAEKNLTDAEKYLLLAKKSSKSPIPEIHKELAQLYSEDMKKYNDAANELELYLKASKLSDADEKNVKKVISGLRDKGKS